MNTYNFQKCEHPLIGEVYLMKFSGTGSEQSGWRPGVVFQNNVGNRHSPNIIALPLTTAIKKRTQPTHTIVYAKNSGLHKDSMVLCENPQIMSKQNVGRYITTLSDDYMRQIAIANLLATSALSYLDPNIIMDIWVKSNSLNCLA